MKFFVVPESSERCTAVMVASGSVTPSFSAAIAGSFQVVMSPLKMWAMRLGVEVQLVDALDVEDDRDRGDVGREVDAPVPAAHEPNAPASSSSFRAESEPAQSEPPAMKVSRPAPEPLGS